MKNPLTYVLLTCLLGWTSVQAQNWDWARSAGGTAYPEEGRAIVTDDEGNVYVTGTHRNFAFFDWFPITSSGGGDIFLTKWDRHGTFEWVVRLGGSGTDKGNGLSLDGQGNIFLAGQADLTAGPNDGHGQNQGGFGSRHLLDGIMAKYAPDGNLQWIKQIDGTVYTISKDIVAETNGNSYTVGTFDGLCYFDLDTTTSEGFNDIFLCRLNAFGTIQWATSFGGVGEDEHPHVALAPNNDAIVAASFEETAFLGTDSLVSYDGKDLCLIRYDNQGNVIWNRSYPGAGNQIVEGLAVDDQGNIVMGGHFTDTLWLAGQTLISEGFSDLFVARFDPMGNPISAFRLGSPGNESIGGLGLARGSRIVIGGTFNDKITLGTGDTLFAAGSADAFLISMDTTWNVLWGRNTGINDREQGLNAAIDPNGNGYLTGFYTSNAIFDSDTLQTNGFEEIYFGKFCTSREFFLSNISNPLCPGGPFSADLEVWGCIDSVNYFLLELSDTTGAFGLPWVLDTLLNAPQGGSFAGNLPSNLPEGTGYRMRVRSTAPVSLSADNGFDLVISRPQLAIVGDTLICPAGDSVLLDAGPGFASYAWSSGAITQSIWVSQAGVYTVDVIDATGCNNQAQIEVSICLGTEVKLRPAWEVFPNPARDFVEIRYFDSDEARLRILDSRGVSVWEGEIRGRAIRRIGLSFLSSGIYLLELKTQEQTSRRKLVRF